MPTAGVLILTAVVSSAVYLACRLLFKPSRAPLPPSPPGLPFLGNVLDIPVHGLFLKIDQWKEEMGTDVFCLTAPGQKMICLTSAQAAADVLDRANAQCCERPKYIMVGDYMTGNMFGSLMPHNDLWRRMRKIVHAGFNIRAAEAFYSVQIEEAGRLVHVLLDMQISQGPSTPVTGADVATVILKAGTSTIWRALYSAPSLFQSNEVELRVAQTNKILDGLLYAAVPFSYLVDVLPILQYAPEWMAGWKREGNKFFRETDAFFRMLWDEGKETGEDGGVKGFAASSEAACKEFGVSQQEAAWVAGTLFIGGAETTVAMVHFFLLAMLLYPEAMRAAQKEIDTLCGTRPPAFADREEMPYLQALIKELLRWRLVLPIGVVHVAVEDFTYRNYLIPKGAMIIDNIWSMNRDPAFFPSPNTFDPTRFLASSEGQYTLKPPLPHYHSDTLCYGHGRRMCPGRDFANNTLFAEISWLLWSFDIEKPEGLVLDDMEFIDKGISMWVSKAGAGRRGTKELMMLQAPEAVPLLVQASPAKPPRFPPLPLTSLL